ncbi:hypothetical protein GGX14DRAFT_562130 [Mycena pura]|uniref:Uncharacterized protein n=1 Tax=Mycena pura TaxID=153505 RepID=A0AAD6YEB6_9AGAR|nr:hypothetical protein GGX14DRAFT_562130 [Mycena pura]
MPCTIGIPHHRPQNPAFALSVDCTRLPRLPCCHATSKSGQLLVLSFSPPLPLFAALPRTRPHTPLAALRSARSHPIPHPKRMTPLMLPYLTPRTRAQATLCPAFRPPISAPHPTPRAVAHTRHTAAAHPVHPNASASHPAPHAMRARTARYPAAANTCHRRVCATCCTTAPPHTPHYRVQHTHPSYYRRAPRAPQRLRVAPRTSCHARTNCELPRRCEPIATHDVRACPTPRPCTSRRTCNLHTTRRPSHLTPRMPRTQCRALLPAPDTVLAQPAPRPTSRHACHPARHAASDAVRARPHTIHAHRVRAHLAARTVAHACAAAHPTSRHACHAPSAVPHPLITHAPPRRSVPLRTLHHVTHACPCTRTQRPAAHLAPRRLPCAVPSGVQQCPAARAAQRTHAPAPSACPADGTPHMPVLAACTSLHDAPMARRTLHAPCPPHANYVNY